MLQYLLKNNFDENGKSIIDNSTGVAAIIIGLFGKPFVDKYFDKLTDEKLENYGLKTYLKAGFVQAHNSLVAIEEQLNDAPIDVYNCMFGDDYDDHLKEVDEWLLKDSEVKFLEEMVKLGRIGFKEDEDLRYEETFASWKPVSSFKKKDEDVDDNELESIDCL